MKEVKNTDNFIKGALLLTLGGIISKVLGAIYRIPLTNLLGTFAMGLYQLVFPLYGLLITAGIGFSIAVSKAVAKERQLNKCVQCTKILRCAFFLLGGIGLVLSIALYLFADTVAQIQGNPLIADAYKILSPSVFLVCISGALRGYFQGQMKMSPSVMSQVAEQIAKLIFGLIFAYRALPDEVGAVNGAIFAVTLSEALSLLVFWLYYIAEKRKNLFFPPLVETPTKDIIKQLAKTALPVTFGGILAPLSQLIDSSLTLKLLPMDATRMYGIWSGPVHSLFAMPLMLSVGIFSAILPDVSGNVAVGNLQEVNKKINLAFKFNTVIVLPCVIGFLFFSPQIIKLLYSSLPAEDVYLSAKLLSMVAVGALFTCYAGTFSSVLQGIGKEYFSLLFTAVGIVIKTIINVIFLPNAKVGVFAIAFSTILCYVVSVTLSALYLRKKIQIKFDWWNTLAKPTFAGVFLAIPLFLSNLLASDFVSTKIGTIVMIAFSGMIYLGAIMALKVFDGLFPTLKNKLYRGKKYAKPINTD